MQQINSKKVNFFFFVKIPLCSKKINKKNKYRHSVQVGFSKNQTVKLTTWIWLTLIQQRKARKRNTVKLSYRCLANMKRKIASHNIKVQKTEEDLNLDPGCNCTGVMESA